MSVPSSRGQALVEFALVTPLFLLLMLGGIGYGLLIMQRMDLLHTAQRAVVYASETTCAGALGKVPQLYGSEPDFKDCTVTGQVVEVTLRDGIIFTLPIVPMPSSLTVTARSMVAPDPSASASP